MQKGYYSAYSLGEPHLDLVAAPLSIKESLKREGPLGRLYYTHGRLTEKSQQAGPIKWSPYTQGPDVFYVLSC